MMQRWFTASMSLALLLGCPGDDGSGATATQGDTTDGTTSTTGTMSGPTSMSASTQGSSGATTEGGSSSSGVVDTGSSGGSSSGSSGGVVMVPVPCGDPLPNFEDTEPNDTPEQAIDGCTLVDFYWGNLPGGSTIGGADVVDYVVFATPVNGGVDLSTPVTPCWDSGNDLLDVFVYEVVDGMADLSAPAYESATPATDCEGDTVMLAESSVFLLELRLATPGAAEASYAW